MCQRFPFSMSERNENEGGKAFFGFFKLVLTMLLFTDKNLTQTIDSNDINNNNKITTTEEGKRIYLVNF